MCKPRGNLRRLCCLTSILSHLCNALLLLAHFVLPVDKKSTNPAPAGRREARGRVTDRILCHAENAVAAGCIAVTLPVHTVVTATLLHSLSSSFSCVCVGAQVGTLRFCGSTEFSGGLWAGVELDRPEGKNDGSVAGVQYFTCRMKHGRSGTRLF